MSDRKHLTTPPPEATAEADAGEQSAPPQLKHLLQEREILRVIRELGYGAKALPKRKPGNSGVKAKVRLKVDLPTGVFGKAWERLRNQGDIRDLP